MSAEKSFVNPQLVIERLALAPGAIIADLGCGRSGHFVFPFAQAVKSSGVVYAVDILKSVLENIEGEAKRRGLKNIRTVWSDLERFGATKIQDNELDIALLATTLYQSKNHPAILKEAYRMIRPIGRFVVIDWKKELMTFGPPKDIRIDQNELADLCESIGFRKVDSFEAGEYHFGLVFEK